MPARAIVRTAATAALAASLGVAVLAGCAAPASDSTGQPSGSGGPDIVTSAPAVSVPPSGPAATAATGSPPPAAQHAVAKVGTVSVNCPDGAPFGDPEVQNRRPLVAGVTITAVVRCETVQRDYPDLGRWDVQLAEVAGAGFETLLGELRKPSAPLTNGPCPAIGYVIPYFALVAMDGSVLRPAVPTGVCGQPNPAAMTALNGLPFEAVDAVRVRQIASPTAVESGCAQQAKDMPAIIGATNREGTARIADLASSPVSVLLCLYRVDPATAQTSAGELVAGRTVIGSQASEIAADTGETRPLPAGCADAPRFATISFGPMSDPMSDPTSDLMSGPMPKWGATVELDGCHRMETSDGFFGAASSGLVDALAAVFAGS